MTETNNNFGDFANTKFTMVPTTRTDAKGDYESEILVYRQPLQWMAETIENVINNTLYREPDINITVQEAQEEVRDEVGNLMKEAKEEKTITSIADLFIACSLVAIGARIAQCSRKKTHFDKKNFEYVSLLGPVLGSYGIYHDSKEAYDIVPILSPELKQNLKDLAATNRRDEFVVPEWYAKAMLFFRQVGMFTNYGLPKEITVDNNRMFKLTVDNGLVIGKPDATTAEVLIASLVYSRKLTDLFGAYRTLYSGISTMRTTFEEIALKSLHALTGR